MMKTHNNRADRIALLTALSTTLLSGSLIAGEKLSYPVTIDLSTRTAYGDLSTARSGSIYDTKSKLQCTVNSENSVGCQAVTSSGATASCQKYQAPQSMVNAVMNLQSDGYVAFTWDANGVCTYILSETSSHWAPRK
jgi:hypothetical protein